VDSGSGTLKHWQIEKTIGQAILSKLQEMTMTEKSKA